MRERYKDVCEEELVILPAWLQNAIDADPGIADYEQAFRDRMYFSGPAETWMNENLVVGNDQNTLIAIEALVYFTKFADPTFFTNSFTAWKSVTKRLKGLTSK